MAAITKTTTLGAVLNRPLDTATFSTEIGMHCLACPASQVASLAAACLVHATTAATLVRNPTASLGE